jgi:hypothetical protein
MIFLKTTRTKEGNLLDVFRENMEETHHSSLAQCHA